jgi:hypothetical protein
VCTSNAAANASAAVTMGRDMEKRGSIIPPLCPA